ncbi:hypothetical protein NQ317_003602 [Molorchus minor]|uniref:Gustatory receptor n=1 Tax=Molorchus minor TaxID=1323400 RepID=A0ABQ9JB01_9CUCU|nr:hypothetical protein NQ317_003602 [Molorchus minor]
MGPWERLKFILVTHLLNSPEKTQKTRNITNSRAGEVFLSSSNLSNGFTSQKRLVRTLWMFVLCSVIWIILSILSVVYMVTEGEISFKWMENSSHWIVIVMKVLLVICTLWDDTVQATVICNYCLQAQLLTSYDIETFKKLLAYLNNEIAPSVCLFTFVNLSFTLSGILWYFKFDNIDKRDVANIWLQYFKYTIMGFYFYCSIYSGSLFNYVCARLTSSCDVLKTVGQEVRARPYVHLETPAYELDSVLIYTTSLKICAKLFYIPIKVKYLWLGITVTAIVLLVLGQCHFLISNIKILMN